MPHADQARSIVHKTRAQDRQRRARSHEPCTAHATDPCGHPTFNHPPGPIAQQMYQRRHTTCKGPNRTGLTQRTRRDTPKAPRARKPKPASKGKQQRGDLRQLNVCHAEVEDDGGNVGGQSSAGDDGWRRSDGCYSCGWQRSGSASGGDDDGGGGGETTEAMGEESGRNRVSDYGIARTAVGDGEEAHVGDGGDTCG